MATLRRIFRSGNSVVVSLPEHYLEQLGLEPGDQVILDTKYTVHNHRFIRVRAAVPVVPPKPSGQ